MIIHVSLLANILVLGIYVTSALQLSNETEANKLNIKTMSSYYTSSNVTSNLLNKSKSSNDSLPVEVIDTIDSTEVASFEYHLKKLYTEEGISRLYNDEHLAAAWSSQLSKVEVSIVKLLI